MKGIACNITEFNSLQSKIHAALCKDVKDYEKNTTKWADKNQVPIHQSTGELLLPVSKTLRYGIIKKLLNSTQKSRIIEVLPGDKNWFKSE